MWLISKVLMILITRVKGLYNIVGPKRITKAFGLYNVFIYYINYSTGVFSSSYFPNKWIYEIQVNGSTGQVFDSG